MRELMKPMLFIGAHPDDIETGAGGLIAKAKKQVNCYVLVFTDCEEQPGNKGITQEFQRSMDTLGIPKENYRLLGFRNTKLPESGEKIRKTLEQYRDKWNPGIVVTHDLRNIHQDHKALAEETVRVFRNTSILMYEHVKSTPQFTANLIVSLQKDELDKKIKALNCYATQKKRYYFNDDFITSLAKVRGKQMNAEYGEGFYVYQFVY